MPDDGPGLDAPRATEPSPRAIVPLDDAECREVLAHQRMCVVSVIDGAEPYAVPVFYGFDGDDVYLGVAEGRKTRALDTNSRVYIVVTEVGPGDAWRSVAIAGRARMLTESAERQRAIDVLIAHNRRFREPRSDGGTAPRRPVGGRVIRIDQSVVTGRSFG
jgi:nitroimidazol reductase NimA-like FMN-containing flavoprotein (pyridoxamine 5'-phosphate oxidase superfamily)